MYNVLCIYVFYISNSYQCLFRSHSRAGSPGYSSTCASPNPISTSPSTRDGNLKVVESLSRVVSTSKLAPDWLHKSEQLIRSQVSKLTQLLTMTTTHKFGLQDVALTLDQGLPLPLHYGPGTNDGERQET